MALEFLAGCIGGCAGVAVGHPFDTVKVRLQTQDPFNPKYKGTWDVLSKTVRSEGPKGLYKGMSSPMAGVAVVNALVFGVHGNLMKQFSDPNKISAQGLAGAGAGFSQAFVVSPMELIKTRMQIQTNSQNSVVAKYTNPIQCMKSIIRNNGLRGLFRGQALTVAREVPGFATYFTTYEYMVRFLGSEDDGPSAFAILTAGGLAGTASWVLTYPIDVIKSRIQADGANGEYNYKNAYHCLKSGLKNEGYIFLTRGLSSTIIRAFPTNAATFAVVNMVMNFGMESSDEDDGGYPSIAWQDVLSKGQDLAEAASMPQPQNYFSVLHIQKNFISSLDKSILMNSLDFDRENCIQ